MDDAADLGGKEREVLNHGELYLSIILWNSSRKFIRVLFN